jgi:cytochrome c-type biogenesis protein CcmH/NrfG
MKIQISAVVLTLGLAAPALHAQGTVLTETMGGSYKDPVQRASDAYSRGARYKAKAEQAKEPKEKAKLYARAKEELAKSVGYSENFDALLAIGQVYLALGQRVSALDACTKARGFKPNDEAAKACATEAGTKTEPVATAASQASPPGRRR